MVSSQKLTVTLASPSCPMLVHHQCPRISNRDTRRYSVGSSKSFGQSLDDTREEQCLLFSCLLLAIAGVVPLFSWLCPGVVLVELLNQDYGRHRWPPTYRLQLLQTTATTTTATTDYRLQLPVLPAQLICRSDIRELRNNYYYGTQLAGSCYLAYTVNPALPSDICSCILVLLL